MSIRRARAVDALYEEVADFDLVFVPDAPLADALNRRLDRPHLGHFAIRPRRLAAGRRETAEDRIAFLELIDQTDLGWKQIAHSVGEVLQCWEHTGRREAIFEYEGYDDAVTETVVDVMGDLETTSSKLTEYEVDDDQSVAVIGEEQLPPLERSVLPEEYTSVDLLTDEPFDLSDVHIFDDSAAIIDALMDAIDREHADDIAVVLDSGSEYSSLVESALESAEIPFYGGPGFADDPDHRALVQLLRACHRGSQTTVGDVRPLLSTLGVDISVDHEQKRVTAVDSEELDWLCALIDSIEERTVTDVVDAYESRSDSTLEAFREELDSLGIADDRATKPTVDRLSFYLDSYDVPVDRENEGVLLADAQSAGHVDRPLVFYLGLDERWTHDAPKRPWVDRDEQFERYIGQFQRMLQNGVDRYYFVQNTRGGEDVTPCLYFHELLEESIETFADFPHVRHSRGFGRNGAAFEREPLDVDPDTEEVISQSRLNSLVNSPRDYLFSQLLDSPDKDYFAEGNLFHDFAEFAVCYPDIVAETNLEELAAVIREEVSPFLNDQVADVRETEYLVGIETIASFLDERRPDPSTFATPTGSIGENFFAGYFDRSVESPITERRFDNEALGISGYIDLVHESDHLLDYKKGAKKRASDLVKDSAIDPPADTPNFQALLYLTHYRTVEPDTKLEFTFFHFLECLDDAVRGDFSVEDCLVTVTYYPQSFNEFVATRDAYEHLLDGWKDCVATAEALGYETYSEIMAEHEFPTTTDKNELQASEFAASLTATVSRAVDNSVDAEKGCEQFIRSLNRFRGQNYFQGDLDAFETFVEERLTQLNEYRAGDERFPIDGPGGEPDYRRVDHRDLLLEGGHE